MHCYAAACDADLFGKAIPDWEMVAHFGMPASPRKPASITKEKTTSSNSAIKYKTSIHNTKELVR